MVLWKLVAVLGLSSLAHADWYVNPVTGNDANSGATPTDAWRTITHANAALSGLEVVQLAAGTYSAASGEVFPIELSAFVSFQGRGRGKTIVEGGGETVFRMTYELGPLPTLLQGLTVRDADVGLEVEYGCPGGGPPCMGPSFDVRDLEVTDSATGLRILVTGGAGGALAFPRFEDCSFSGNLVGIDAHCRAALRLRLVRCDVSDNAGAGILQFADSELTDGSDSTVTLHGCRVERNGGTGIEVTFEAEGGTAIAHTELFDTLVADNGGDGLSFGTVSLNPFSSDHGRALPVLFRSTIANNAGRGVFAETAERDGTPAHPVHVNASILFGNGDDLEWIDPAALVEWSNVGDGDFAGVNGNVSLDPRFRDPLGGDYRLRAGSPCVDTGNVTPGSLWDVRFEDPEGTSRDVDGNLDLLEVADVGAFELATLFLTNEPVVGATLELELVGPRLAVLRAALGPPISPPQVSIFGDVDLDHTQVVFLGGFDAGFDPPGIARFPLKADRSVLGLDLTFQALLSSRLAPAFFATSNPVHVTVGL